MLELLAYCICRKHPIFSSSLNDYHRIQSFLWFSQTIDIKHKKMFSLEKAWFPFPISNLCNLIPSFWLQEQHEKGGGDGGPCSTLFIANLGPNCTEDELKQALSVWVSASILFMNLQRVYGIAVQIGTMLKLCVLVISRSSNACIYFILIIELTVFKPIFQIYWIQHGQNAF